MSSCKECSDNLQRNHNLELVVKITMNVFGCSDNIDSFNLLKHTLVIKTVTF